MAIDVSKAGVRGRRPSHRGSNYSRVSRGVEIVQAWPKKRGKKLNPKTAEQMEYFRQVQWAFKFSDPMVQQSYSTAVHGTPLMPRDLFLMAASGRMHFFITPSGKKMFSMAAVQDVSDSLDVLEQRVGYMLTRSAERWQGLAPGPAGYVLTSTGETTPPEYAPVSAPSSTDWGDIGGTLADQTDLQAALDAKGDLAGNNVWTGDNTFGGSLIGNGPVYSDVGLLAGNLYEIAPNLTHKSRFTIQSKNSGANPGHIDDFQRGIAIYQNGATPGAPGAMRAALENTVLSPGYTVEIRGRLIDPTQATAEFQGGILIWNSVNGRYITWGWCQSAATLVAQIFASDTSGNQGQYCAASKGDLFPWIRVRTTTGGNIFFEMSTDGFYWLTAGSTTFGNYVGAADYAGVGCYAVRGITTMNGVVIQSYRLQ